MRQIQLPLNEVFILGKRRSADPKKVAMLAESIKQIGLQTPITVRQADEDYIDPSGDDLGKVFALVAGRHRLEAMRSLGSESIDAIVMDKDAVTARKWEIAENLHRAELTPLERDEQTAEWVSLANTPNVANKSQGGQNVHPVGGAQPFDKGISKAARELPIVGKTEQARRKNVERALEVASLSDEAKETARDLGLDSNRTALLEAAKKTTPKKQVEALKHRAEARTKRRQCDALEAEDEAFADWLLEHAEPREVAQIVSWLEMKRNKQVVEIIRRRNNQND